MTCLHVNIERRPDLDGPRTLRFVCRTCETDLYKDFGQPDSAVRPLTNKPAEVNQSIKSNAWESARIRRNEDFRRAKERQS